MTKMTKTTFDTCLLCSCAAVALLSAPTFAQSAAGGSQIETVTVTATRLDAVDLKETAPIVLDAISEEQIKQLPDVNAAEALERIPGISMESDSGEGRFVNIRGMDADLNGTTYDGVRLTASNASSPQGGARAVAFDAFPEGILGGLEVIKTLTPDMDAEGLGGVVNILPRTIPNGKTYFVEGSLGTGLEPLRGTPIYQGDVTAGTRFGADDDMSVIGSFTMDDDKRGIDDIEEDYLNSPPDKTFQDVQYRYYSHYHRTRMGFGGGYTWAPDDNTLLFLRGIHAGYTELAFKHRLEIAGLGDDIIATDPQGDITVDSAQPEIDITNSGETVANNMIEGGGETLIGGFLKAALRLSWTRGEDIVYRSDGFTFQDPNMQTVEYNNSIAAYPTYKVLDGTNFQDPSIYTSFSGSNGPSKNFDQEWAGKLDFSLPVGRVDGDAFKFGGSVRLRSRHASADLANPFVNSLPYSAFAVAKDDIYYGDRYNVGPAPNYWALAALPLSGPFVEDPTAFEHDNENVFAGYADYSATVDKLDINVGLRVESTAGIYRANEFITDPLGNTTMVLNAAKHDYTNLFPDLNLTYHVTSDMQVRAAITTAIARPGFNQITGSRSIDYTQDTISTGNPSLKPTTGLNYDLSAEYYLPNGGIASVGLFYKAFSDYIIPTVLLNQPSPNPAITTAHDFQLNSFSNIGSAHADGIELDYSQQFTFLPDPLDGLGVDGNLTAVGSAGDIRQGEKHTLPQTSPFNYNAALFYTKGPIDLRIASSYVSRNLWAVSDDDADDNYSQPRFRLDFGGSYDICDILQWYVDIKNITNTKLEFTQSASKDFPVQREFYGPTYMTGIRIKLGD
jgi:TonB-dependent receptor